MEISGKNIDAKFIFGKAIFFMALVLFMGVFSTIFGSENTLIGVTVVVAALMMLMKDMSARPISSLAGLLAINLSMGLGAYIALYNPWLGIAVNFGIIFSITYVTMHDLKMPFWFPFILGYAFICSMPVSAENLPLRLESLAVGAVFIVGLNLLVNRKRTAKTCHAGIIGLLNCTVNIIEKKNSGEEQTLEEINKTTSSIISSMYDRVKDKYFVTLAGKSVLNLSVALEELGQVIVEKEHDKEDLKDLAVLLNKIVEYESDSSDYESLHRSICEYLDSHPGVHPRIRSALKITDYELEVMGKGIKEEKREYDTGDVPHGFKFRTFMKENLSKDSLKFTFAFRLALMMTLWLFVADYFELENAKWLVFTLIAIVAPYIEGSVKKSKQRLGGTAIGVVVFLLITPLLTSVSTITVIMLIIGFIYTVFDPMRYVIQMAFNTVSALLTALMIMPDSPLVWERILFIAVGVGAALAANRIILPYHIKDETMDLAGKCMSVARNQIRDLGNTLRGEGDSNKNAALIVNAFAVTNKIALNNSQEPNPEVEEFLKAQYEIILNSAFMKRQMSASEIDSETKEKLLYILEKYGPDGDENLPDGIQTNGNPIVEDAVEILTYYGKCSKLSSRMMTG